VACSGALALAGPTPPLVPRLVAALLRQSEPVEVVLLIPPRHQSRAARLARHASGRVRYHVVDGRADAAGPDPLPRSLSRLRELHRTARVRAEAAGTALCRHLRRHPLAGGLLLSLIAPALWALFALYRLAVSLARSASFPARWLVRRALRASQPHPPRSDGDLLAHMTAAACDLWVLPSRGSYPPLPFPTLVLIDDPGCLWPAGVKAGNAAPDFEPLLPPHVLGATLYGYWPPREQGRDLVSVGPLSPDRLRRLSDLPRGWWRLVEDWYRRLGRAGNQSATSWLALFREVVELARWRQSMDSRLREPWPCLEPVPARPRPRAEVFLFLHQVHIGGVWETTKELLQDLVAINQTRNQLSLTVGLHESQLDTRPVEQLGQALTLKWLRLNPINRAEVAHLLGGTPPWLTACPEQEFSFPSGAALSALQADAWLALVDRFPVPLLPARPYGVFVYDMIQRHRPQGFPGSFFRGMAAGMAPSMRRAELILATTPQTRDDVIVEYGLDPDRVVLVPLACNPARRFRHLTPVAIPRAREPFLLNVTGSGEHKGAKVILRGYARLKARLGPRTPQLVLCGWGTQAFLPSYNGAEERPHWQAMRRLGQELGLREGRDLVGLGFVRDEELLDLYQRCAVVVNAALYDNGSFTLPEGAYFGRPTVSARYPAAEFLCRRYDIPAAFFPPGDAEGMAQALERALERRPASATEVDGIRARFAEPEFSSRRYAERIYDVLVKLAEQGRRVQPVQAYRPASAGGWV
jgi:glycosyltransferase involved in cell wall biosynthesis